jgi:hypothetical protein
LVTEKNGRILFDRPKPTAGCSASGRKILPVTPLPIFAPTPVKYTTLSGMLLGIINVGC